MYAARRTYVKQWDHEPPEKTFTVSVSLGGKPYKGIEPERISYVEEEIMYWRKANHIHAWFVENVQDGEDDCKSYYVSKEKLEELLSVCKQVLKSSELVDGMITNGTEYSKDHPNGKALVEPGKVIKDPTVAKKLLPTQEGFFFGSYEYDEWYLGDVQTTHDWIVRTLGEEGRYPDSSIMYHSSW